MIVAVTAPRNGLGKTISAINIGAAITRALKDKVLIIDVDKYCQDIEYYLSDSDCTKGIDDFYSLFHSRLLNNQTFLSCVKEVNANIDMMTSNQCFDIGTEEIEELIRYTKLHYQATIFDTISSNNEITQNILEKADVIVVVVNQMRNTVRKLINEIDYKRYNGKTIFVINKYLDNINNQKIKYGFNEIKKELESFYPDSYVFRLNFDVQIINESNNHSMLNYVLNKDNSSTQYITELEEVVRKILDVKSESKDISSHKLMYKFHKLIPLLTKGQVEQNG